MHNKKCVLITQPSQRRAVKRQRKIDHTNIRIVLLRLNCVISVFMCAVI